MALALLVVVPAGRLHAFCWSVLNDVYTVCTEDNWGGQSCTTYWEFYIYCEGGGGGSEGGGGNPPGGGGPPVVCPEVLVTNLQSIQASGLSGYGKLVGSVSVYPANADVELSADGPGLSGVGYGAGPFEFSSSLDNVSMGDNWYTVTARGPSACGSYSNSASGIINRARYRATAWDGAAPYTLYFYDPITGQNRSLYPNGTIGGFELFDHYVSSPDGQGNDIPYTRTVSSTASAELVTLPEYTLVGADVGHEYTGYAWYWDAMFPQGGNFWPPDGPHRKTFGVEAVHWFGLQPSTGVSSLDHMIIDYYGSWTYASPFPLGFGAPARAEADFSSASPY